MKYRAEIRIMRFFFWLAVVGLLAFLGTAAVIAVQVITNV